MCPRKGAYPQLQVPHPRNAVKHGPAVSFGSYLSLILFLPSSRPLHPSLTRAWKNGTRPDSRPCRLSSCVVPPPLILKTTLGSARRVPPQARFPAPRAGVLERRSLRLRCPELLRRFRRLQGEV